MKDIIRLTRQIHYFVRGELRFNEELKLLTEIVESEKWLNHLDSEIVLYLLAQENQISDSMFAIENDKEHRSARQSIRELI